jgi:hypothetical protein
MLRIMTGQSSRHILEWYRAVGERKIPVHEEILTSIYAIEV